MTIVGEMLPTFFLFRSDIYFFNREKVYFMNVSPTTKEHGETLWKPTQTQGVFRKYIGNSPKNTFLHLLAFLQKSTVSYVDNARSGHILIENF